MKALSSSVFCIVLAWSTLIANQGFTQDTSKNNAGEKSSNVRDIKHPSQWQGSAIHQRLVREANQSVEQVKAQAAKDRFRPAFHFLPAGRFMNDPNGCIQINGVYHMFFQHQPYFGEPDVPMLPAWGHASSRDLVHWKHLPIALMPVPNSYDKDAVASGACVNDNGHPTIVYTSVPPQAQSLARSFDGMLTWRRFAGNPVITEPPAIPDFDGGFRDPFVWREGDNWRMVVGAGIRGKGGTVLLYGSKDLVSWEYLGQLCTGMGADCFQWECPNFFKLGDKWVLIVSPLYRSVPGFRGPVQYSVGDFDGKRFIPGPWHALDFGGPTIFYAPNSLLDDQGRRILWGWVMGGGEPGSKWHGMLTVPRKLELGPDKRLRVYPVANINMLRGKQLVNINMPKTLVSGESLDICKGNQLDISLELKRSLKGKFNVKLWGSTLTVQFDMATGELRCNDKAGIVPRSDGDTVALRILVDHSVVEVYADHCETMTLLAHQPEGSDTATLVVEEGPLELKSLQAWQMNAAEIVD